MKKISNIVSKIFMLLVVVLSLVAITGIWKLFDGDVIYKSFQSIAFLAIISIIILIADRFIDKKTVDSSIDNTSEIVKFKSIRSSTSYIFIGSLVFLAILGLLAIWEVLSDQVLGKTFATIGVVAFASLVIVLVCLARERSLNPSPENRKISGWAVFGIIIVVWLGITLLLSTF